MSLGSHQARVGKSQVHLTPRWIVDALGPFDLDPCAATIRPWDCAIENYVEADDGLALPWRGFVWCNPPFDSRIVGAWVQKLAEHGDGVLLIHARTETQWFRPIWERAALICFLARRVNFHQPDGTPGIRNSGAPVVLAAFGARARARLKQSGIPGAYVDSFTYAAGLA